LKRTNKSPTKLLLFIPAKAGIHSLPISRSRWIPAFAGMTAFAGAASSQADGRFAGA
jgi:hypothetical protein